MYGFPHAREAQLNTRRNVCRLFRKKESCCMAVFGELNYAVVTF
jgi:hypothetical protein